LKTGIEAAVTALAAIVNCGRDHDGDLDHRARTLRDDNGEFAWLTLFEAGGRRVQCLNLASTTGYSDPRT
jgi:hypothetical protein